MSKRISLFFVALVVVAVIVGIAKAATYPLWVANNPSTGGVKVWDSVIGDYKLSSIEVTATANDVTFSAWSYDASRGTPWLKVSPVRGLAAGDTVITVPAGETRGYLFPMRVDLFYLNSGALSYWSGE